ncbi:MAG: PAS domain-containing protein [Methylocella sp.]
MGDAFLALPKQLRSLAGPLLDALAMSNIPLAVADACSRDYPIVFVNAAFAALTGYDSDDVAGGDLRLLGNLDVGLSKIAAINNALAAGQTVNADLQSSRKNGDLFWNRLSIAPIRDEAGAAKFLLSTQSDVTAEYNRREIEDKLADSRRELADIEANARLSWTVAGLVGAWEWDIASGRLFADVRFSKLCGLPPAEAAAGLPSKSFFAHIHPDDVLRTRIAVAAALQGAEVFSRDYRILGADGCVRWVSARGRSHLGADDRPVRFTGVVTDITDQKRIEEQLHLAQTAGGVGTFQYETGFGTVDVSEQFCRLLGLHPSTVLPVRTINSVVHRDDPAIIGGAEALSTDGLSYSEFRIRRPDNGQERWLALRGQLHCEAGGRRFIGAIYDVTDSKLAQEKLRELNQTLESRVQERTQERDRVWNLSRDLIHVCSADGVQRAVNPAWTELLGYAAEELVGARFERFVHPDDRAHAKAIFDSLAAGGRAKPFDLRLLAKDGSARWINWTITADDDAFYCVGRDITERKQLEDELRQSQKMEAVGQLTGGIAHDFNNLLTGVIGSMDIIRRRIADGRVQDIGRFVDAATTSAQSAAALTHRLLAFSRRQSLDNQPIDVNQLVASMEDLLRRTLGEQIVLQVELRAGIRPAMTDANQLESAVLNLAINARDAMPEGGVLTIETKELKLDRAYAEKHDHVQPGDYVAISVRDTGSGMSEDVVAKAFDPFFTTKPIGQGTGLGLSMIYGFAQQTGGHVTISSKLGEGAEIKLYLPVCHGDAVRAEPGANEEGPSGSGEHVLVVEDDASVRLIVLDVLHELGYAALEASNGITALSIIQSPAPIDLLITDVGLPGLNGRQLAEIARQSRPNLPILFMTAYAANAAVRNDFLGKRMHMVTKPVSMDVLALKIREIIEARG